MLTARIHPGESNSSYVMKGIIDFLTSDDSFEASILRKNFVFKIVPMINVDGVVYGNYRCSISGIDLNRVWKKPNPVLFPEVVAIRKMIENFHLEHPVVLFTDLHGHSRARKAFMYGNNYLHNPVATRLFPFILSKLEPDIFSFVKSRFKISKSKEGTSRLSVWRMLKIPAVYTLETSLCGAAATSAMPHFSTENLAFLGRKLCMAILVF